MSPLTATCRNCGQAKAITNYEDTYCPNCTTAKIDAEKNAPEGTSMSDRLRAGKEALASHAHNARVNWMNPRNFSQNSRHGL